MRNIPFSHAKCEIAPTSTRRLQRRWSAAVVAAAVMLWAPSGFAGGGNLGTIGPSSPSAFIGDTVTGAFNDIWTFNLAADSQLAASVTNVSILVNGLAQGDILGFGATLNGFALTLTQANENQGSFEYQVQRLTGSTLAAPGSFTLDVFGSGIRGATNASYSGNIFANPPLAAAVPEPGTVALLMAGLAIVLLNVRRHNAA